MFFSYEDTGTAFELLSLQHFLSIILFAVLPCLAVYFLKDAIRNMKHEKVLRIFIGVFAAALELSLYVWYVLNGGITDPGNKVATTLCGLAIYLGCYSMITLNRKIASVVYFYSFGAVLSFLIGDIHHGFDRFRFYTYFVMHGFILVCTVYFRVVHSIKADKKAFIRSGAILLPILVSSFAFSHILDTNLFFMAFPPIENFPVIQQIYDLNEFLYSLLTFSGYYIFLSGMFILSKMLKLDMGKSSPV